jgi:hypothetical protein
MKYGDKILFFFPACVAAQAGFYSFLTGIRKGIL